MLLSVTSFSKSLPELNMPIKCLYSYTVAVLFVKWLRIETTGMFLWYQGRYWIGRECKNGTITITKITLGERQGLSDSTSRRPWYLAGILGVIQPRLLVMWLFLWLHKNLISYLNHPECLFKAENKSMDPDFSIHCSGKFKFLAFIAY